MMLLEIPHLTEHSNTHVACHPFPLTGIVPKLGLSKSSWGTLPNSFHAKYLHGTKLFNERTKYTEFT